MSRIAEASPQILYTAQVGHVKYSSWNNRRVLSRSHDPLSNIGAPSYLWNGETINVKYGMQIDCGKY